VICDRFDPLQQPFRFGFKNGCRVIFTGEALYGIE
jgi:hypothetical protein